ncbi:MAG: 16S rRNA (cytidine(1402)-2'-O)-methyltransferase [Flavobacteriales bacterium]|nr:16S rRNA (cytidine(1402)-2'-O)-methyltransferase [Flavobacteriales bacterium]|tara:strand:+ start:743 stop:1411 length:669 start_codon:yes stop_codon:yes gene_type:complete
MSKLYLVPTPIGNLKDITYRGVNILNSVDIILAEDTRKTKKLLSHYDIKTKMFSYHMFNEHKKLQKWIDKLLSGIQIAIVSDAGTPSISDPGFLLVRECMKNNIDTECLPGPTAFLPALVSSGFSCDRFIFEGFLPNKKGRTKRLKMLVDYDMTFILYESPHRLLRTLKQLSAFLGSDQLISVSREISKIHEENKRGKIIEIISYYELKKPKGEFVIIVSKK